jgi:hypothetical protein
MDLRESPLALLLPTKWALATSAVASLTVPRHVLSRDGHGITWKAVGRMNGSKANKASF